MYRVVSGKFSRLTVGVQGIPIVLCSKYVLQGCLTVDLVSASQVASVVQFFKRENPSSVASTTDRCIDECSLCDCVYIRGRFLCDRAPMLAVTRSRSGGRRSCSTSAFAAAGRTTTSVAGAHSRVLKPVCVCMCANVYLRELVCVCVCWGVCWRFCVCFDVCVCI